MYKIKLLALAVTLAIIALFYCNDTRSVEAGQIASDEKQFVVGRYDGSVVSYELQSGKGVVIK